MNQMQYEVVHNSHSLVPKRAFMSCPEWKLRRRWAYLMTAVVVDCRSVIRSFPHSVMDTRHNHDELLFHVKLLLYDFPHMYIKLWFVNAV